jgi:hypothetical protein
MVKQHLTLRKSATLAATIAGLSFPAGVGAQVAQVDYGSLTGTQTVSFNSVPGGPGVGTNYDDVLVVNGVAFGERFNGQTITPLGNFDQLGGTPSAGLTLLAGDPGHNLTVFQSPAGAVLSGNGTLGYPEFDAIGEGAVSILFSTDQSEFGFRLAGGNGGNAYVSFFRNDGSLIQSTILNNLPVVASYGFSRDGGIHDIRGVSIWNDDVTGFGFGAFRFDVASAVPEPATWTMMILGFGLVGAFARRVARTPECLAGQSEIAM